MKMPVFLIKCLSLTVLVRIDILNRLILNAFMVYNVAHYKVT